MFKTLRRWSRIRTWSTRARKDPVARAAGQNRRDHRPLSDSGGEGSCFPKVARKASAQAFASLRAHINAPCRRRSAARQFGRGGRDRGSVGPVTRLRDSSGHPGQCGRSHGRTFPERQTTALEEVRERRPTTVRAIMQILSGALAMIRFHRYRDQATRAPCELPTGSECGECARAVQLRLARKESAIFPPCSATTRSRIRGSISPKNCMP